MTRMKHLPGISLVTPSFNQGAYLEATLRSVLEQEYPNLQHIIIDGGSTDDSRDILEYYRPAIESAGGRIIIEPDDGQTQAINKGLRLATGDIVGWLCSDDLLLPRALETVGFHFTDRPDRNWCAGVCRMIDPQGEFIAPNRPEGIFTLEGVLMRNQERPFNLPQPSVFWRRRLHDQLGLLDESLHYCMDFEFWVRLLSAGYAPALLDVELACYRLHETSKTCAAPEGFLREHLVIERKYARQLPLALRLKVLRRLGYNRRTCAIQSTTGRPWGAVLRRPWWLLSQQVRLALWEGEHCAPATA